MKKIFIPTYNKTIFDLNKILNKINKIPGKIFITYSIQYKYSAEKIKKSLDPKKVSGFSQVLGCSRPKIPRETKYILLIGSGIFHGVSLALETGLQVYVLENNKINLISEKEIQRIKQLQKSSYTRFLNSKSIGIFISLKPGQNSFNKALELKNSLEAYYDKDVYIFVADNINLDETENFSEIDSWVNTACPRLSLNRPDIINLNDIEINN